MWEIRAYCLFCFALVKCRKVAHAMQNKFSKGWSKEMHPLSFQYEQVPSTCHAWAEFHFNACRGFWVQILVLPVSPPPTALWTQQYVALQHPSYDYEPWQSPRLPAISLHNRWQQHCSKNAKDGHPLSLLLFSQTGWARLWHMQILLLVLFAFFSFVVHGQDIKVSFQCDTCSLFWTYKT